MLGTTLHYDYEVRDENVYFGDLSEPEIPKEMVDLASHILDTKAGHFDTAQFTDQYEEELRQLVERKAEGKVVEPRARREGVTNIVSLLDALRRSVEGAKPVADNKDDAARSSREKRPRSADAAPKSPDRKRKAM